VAVRMMQAPPRRKVRDRPIASDSLPYTGPAFRSWVSV
jgi:hypothetical protein